MVVVVVGGGVQADLQMLGGLVDGREDASGLDDVAGAGLGPGDAGWVPLEEGGDRMAVDLELSRAQLGYGAGPTAVGGVELEEVHLGGRPGRGGEE